MVPFIQSAVLVLSVPLLGVKTLSMGSGRFCLQNCQAVYHRGKSDREEVWNQSVVKNLEKEKFLNMFSILMIYWKLQRHKQQLMYTYTFL